jgi:hypothetical protein
VRPLELGHLVEDALPHRLDVGAELGDFARPAHAHRVVDVGVGDPADLAGQPQDRPGDDLPQAGEQHPEQQQDQHGHGHQHRVQEARRRVQLGPAGVADRGEVVQLGVDRPADLAEQRPAALDLGRGDRWCGRGGGGRGRGLPGGGRPQHGFQVVAHRGARDRAELPQLGGRVALRADPVGVGDQERRLTAELVAADPGFLVQQRGGQLDRGQALRRDHVEQPAPGLGEVVQRDPAGHQRAEQQHGLGDGEQGQPAAQGAAGCVSAHRPCLPGRG